jgi:hypothetical protein
MAIALFLALLFALNAVPSPASALAITTPNASVPARLMSFVAGVEDGADSNVCPGF